MYMLPPFHQDAFMILIAWTLYSSDLLELMLRHFIQTHQTCGMESVFLLSSNVIMMYFQCTFYVLAVIALYLSCITDVLEVVPYTPVFLHTLALTFLGPSPSGHPVFGISSPWVWLLGVGGSHGMAAPDTLFCRQGMHIPACPVGCFAAETTPGQASRWGPYSPGSRNNILGCCEGSNRAQTTVKNPSQVPEKNLSDVFTLYLECIWGVSTMNHTSIDGYISH
jgi:hypothetical protein